MAERRSDLSCTDVAYRCPRARRIFRVARRCRQASHDSAITHATFHTNSHQGRHQAPVCASTTSEPPNITNVIPATTQARRAAPRRVVAASRKQRPTNVHSPASTQFTVDEKESAGMAISGDLASRQRRLDAFAQVVIGERVALLNPVALRVRHAQ